MRHDAGAPSHADWYSRVPAATREMRRAGQNGAELLRSAGQPPGRYEAPAFRNIVLQVATGRGAHRLDLGEGRFTATLSGRERGFVLVPGGTSIVVETTAPIDLLAVDFPESALADDHGGALRALPGLHARPFHDPVIEGVAEHLWALAGDGTRLECDAATLTLAGLLRRLGAPAAPRFGAGLAPWQLRRVEEFLRDHLAEDVPIAALAAQAKLSPFHFARQFKASTGLPPHAYQRRLRAERAQALLAGTEMDVTAVALAVGYDTPQSFARAFRAETGASPTAWRRERRG